MGNLAQHLDTWNTIPLFVTQEKLAKLSSVSSLFPPLFFLLINTLGRFRGLGVVCTL